MPIANADREAMLTISVAGSTGTGWVVDTLVGWLARDASRTVGLTAFSAPVEQAERSARLAMSADGFIGLTRELLHEEVSVTLALKALPHLAPARQIAGIAPISVDV